MVLIEARHSNLKVSSNCQIINILDNYAYINFVLHKKMAVSYMVSNYVAISVNVQKQNKYSILFMFKFYIML